MLSCGRRCLFLAAGAFVPPQTLLVSAAGVFLGPQVHFFGRRCSCLAAGVLDGGWWGGVPKETKQPSSSPSHLCNTLSAILILTNPSFSPPRLETSWGGEVGVGGRLFSHAGAFLWSQVLLCGRRSFFFGCRPLQPSLQSYFHLLPWFPAPPFSLLPSPSPLSSLPFPIPPSRWSPAHSPPSPRSSPRFPLPLLPSFLSFLPHSPHRC